MKPLDGEYTLLYNGKDMAHPVGLKIEDHEILQAFVMALKNKIILNTIKCKYERIANK